MEWEIKESINEKDYLIVKENVGHDCIEWDFPYNSDFDLCAVFQNEEESCLEECKRKGIRPLLFHKDLCLKTQILSNSAIKQICLYPATILEGKLFIGKQKYNNIITFEKKKSRVNIIIWEKIKNKRWFSIRTEYESVQKIFVVEEEGWDGRIFYKIENDSEMNVYLACVIDSSINVVIEKNQIIRFYMDEECKREIFGNISDK